MRFDRKILATSISDIYTKKFNTTRRIAGLKMKLRETFGLSGCSIELEEAKLDRIVRRKTREVRKRLCKKLDNLISYKKQAIDEKKHREAKQVETMKRSDVDKKIYTIIVAANSTRKSLTFSRWD